MEGVEDGGEGGDDVGDEEETEDVLVDERAVVADPVEEEEGEGDEGGVEKEEEDAPDHPRHRLACQRDAALHFGQLEDGQVQHYIHHLNQHRHRQRSHHVLVGLVVVLGTSEDEDDGETAPQDDRTDAGIDHHHHQLIPQSHLQVLPQHLLRLPQTLHVHRHSLYGQSALPHQEVVAASAQVYVVLAVEDVPVLHRPELYYDLIRPEFPLVADVDAVFEGQHNASDLVDLLDHCLVLLVQATFEVEVLLGLQHVPPVHGLHVLPYLVRKQHSLHRIALQSLN